MTKHEESNTGRCEVPPFGWFCTRDAGHDGPCAAIEDDGTAPGSLFQDLSSLWEKKAPTPLKRLEHKDGPEDECGCSTTTPPVAGEPEREALEALVVEWRARAKHALRYEPNDSWWRGYGLARQEDADEMDAILAAGYRRQPESRKVTTYSQCNRGVFGWVQCPNPEECGNPKRTVNRIEWVAE